MHSIAMGKHRTPLWVPVHAAAAPSSIENGGPCWRRMLPRKLLEENASDTCQVGSARILTVSTISCPANRVDAASDGIRRAEIRMTYSPRRSRLTWALVVVVLLVVAFWTLPGAGQRGDRSEATPRAVDRSSRLPGDEQATIELFERSRGSVTYITTQARVVDPWTRNMFDISRNGFGIRVGRAHRDEFSCRSRRRRRESALERRTRRRGVTRRHEP